MKHYNKVIIPCNLRLVTISRHCWYFGPLDATLVLGGQITLMMATACIPKHLYPMKMAICLLLTWLLSMFQTTTCFPQEGDEAAQDVERLTQCKLSFKSKEVGQLLGHVIGKRYPHVKDAVPFKELLQWDLWPSLMKIYCEQILLYAVSLFIFLPIYCLHPGQAKASGSIIIQGLPKNVDKLCYCTYSSFDAKHPKLLSGEICFADLEHISIKEDQMKKLCTATTAEGTDEKVFEVVKRRLEELHQFQLHRTQLGNFCSTIPDDVTVEG